MNDGDFARMADVMRLTRAGRLQEATSAIQRLLHGQPVPPVADAPIKRAERPLPGAFRVIREQAFRATGASHVQPTSHRPRAVPRRAPDARGQFITASYTNEAGRRSYKFYVPSSFRGQSLPLVVMLHGCTQDPDDFAAGTRMNRVAEEHPCVVLYPAQAQSANPSKCWNWFKEGDQRRDEGEPSIVAGITRRIIASHNIDSRRVYVAGLSAGGAMAMTMGRTYPDLYAAIGVHSGLAYAVAHDLASAFTVMRQDDVASARLKMGQAPRQTIGERVIPTIVFHGDRDRTVHPLNGELVIAQSLPVSDAGNADGRASSHVTVERNHVANGHAYTRTIYHDAGGQPSLEHWLVHGAGHAWSGGSSDGSFTDPKGPDATKEMMRFFWEHPRRAPH
jgi:poly(hydroxyalkanoate) depolymerase family esterase